jgi:hypothetical protein
VLAVQGKLQRSAATAARAWKAAERFGNPGVIRFLESERCATAYWLGEWDDAVRIADTFESRAQAGSPHYGERLCRQVRAAIRLARGDARGAEEDSIASLDAARALDDFQNLLPALALRARVLAETGRPAESAEVLAEALAVWRERGRDELVSFWTFDLVLSSGGEPAAEVRRLMGRARLRTLWVDAALALLEGRFEEAAAAYGRIGALPEQALSLLHAAERRGQGDQTSVAALLDPAVTFLRRVGATGYLRRSEAVLVTA